MEFHEKLQALRKNKGLTQEELAEALYISRTAISKWESGRGYPSIDSLKAISAYFSVSIDDLLSGEALLSIAENENRTNMQNIYNLLLGIVDLFYALLIILPLYPNRIDGYIYSVNLFKYVESISFHCLLHWVIIVALITVGAAKMLLTKHKNPKIHKWITILSIGFSILFILFLAMSREAYATTMAFLLFVIKGFLLFKFIKTVN